MFGPTFEMIMQFEDLTRKDIVVTLEAEGEIKRRTAGNNANKVGIALRVLMSLHRNVLKTMRWWLFKATSSPKRK